MTRSLLTISQSQKSDISDTFAFCLDVQLSERLLTRRK